MNDNRYYRDPYAAGGRQRSDSKPFGMSKQLRKAIFIALAVLVAGNAVLTAATSGMLSCERKEKPASSQNGGAGDQAQQGGEDVPHPDTAYYRVTPAVGNYSELIDRYVAYERSVMQPDELVVTFTGDCTLGTWPDSNKDTNYTALYNASGSPTYSFDNVKSLFLNDDYTFINLETTLTQSTKKLDSQYYNFKGSPSWANDMIAASGIDGCNIANNHAYDWGQSGYDETTQSLTAAGVDVGDEKLVVVTKLNNVEVVMLCGNYIYPCGGEQLYGDALTDYLVGKVKEYKRADNIVIVNAHWGLERQHDANADQTTPAHKFIDAGADMVVAHHPHTLQGAEYYKDRFIFYSLGNFAFGGKGTTDEVNRAALMLRVRLALRDGAAQVTGVLGVPCYTTSAANIEKNNYMPKPLCGKEAADMQGQLVSYSSGLGYGLTTFECPAASWNIAAANTGTDTNPPASSTDSE